MDHPYFIVSCPHCKVSIQIFRHELNCRIFRHGVFRDTMEPINPHAPKDQCDQWAREHKIFGCGKPFRIMDQPGHDPPYQAVICDYL